MLGTIVGTALLILNGLVVVAILAVLATLGLTAMRLAKRAGAMVPRELIAQVNRGRDDVARLQTSLAQFEPLLVRLRSAIASIAISLEHVRTSIALVRSAFGGVHH